MSTPITYDIGTLPRSRTETQSEKGWFRRALDRLMAARQAQAERLIVDSLNRMSDERLAEYGYTKDQIRMIRVDRRLPALSEA